MKGYVRGFVISLLIILLMYFNVNTVIYAKDVLSDISFINKEGFITSSINILDDISQFDSNKNNTLLKEENILLKGNRLDNLAEINYILEVAPTMKIEDEVNVDYLSAFKELSEKEFLNALKGNFIVSAIKNLKSNYVYVVLEDHSSYCIEDENCEVENFLLLSGIEVQKVAILTTEQVVQAEKEAKATTNRFWSITLTCSFFFILICFIYKRYKNMNNQLVTVSNGGSSTELKGKEGVPTVKLADVEGIEELKSDILCLVDCLKHPDKYSAIGARIPHGVILYGPPGTGKTLIAKALAGEAGVPFFSVVGSDFVEKYVGVGASRVRDLYQKARKAAPCIVFIDEIDAVASQRGEDNNSERDQTINALLAELDGFKASDSIITICATNRLELLDSAFKRSGRFDLKLAVGLPDRKSREKILEIHSRNKKLASCINLDSLAVKTQGFCGADLEALLNEAALAAVKKGKEEIDNDDIEDAFFKIVMQGNKKKRDKITETNRVVAWHEAGHTLATKLLTDDSVSSVTIIGSSSGAGGVTFRAEKEDNILHSRKYLENLVQVMYAGRAAEELYFGDADSITTGASQDIKQATSIIKEYLGLYGMGTMGMIDVSQFRHDFSDIVTEASEMAKRLYKSVLNLLNENKKLLVDLAENLLEKETLEESEIDSIIARNLKKTA